MEADAHNLRRIYVSHKTEIFKEEVAAAEKRWRSKPSNKKKCLPKYWVGFVRLAGIKQRDGNGVVSTLPMKLVPPQSAPPPESKQDIKSSGLLKHISLRTKKAPTLLHTDGNMNWQRELEAAGIPTARVINLNVSHRKKQLLKKQVVKLGKQKKKEVSVATQIIDRWWQSFDDFIPPQVKNKEGKGKGVNPKLIDYVYGYVWRAQLPVDADFRLELGKICVPK